MDIWKAVDISLVGVGLSPVELVCWSQSNVNILYSYNVTIRNFLFNSVTVMRFTKLVKILELACLFLNVSFAK